MLNAALIVGVILVYVVILFCVAMWGERKGNQRLSAWQKAGVYSLSLAIYCTSWTFYGSVGEAVSSGMLFLTIYIGPTLGIILWRKVLQKLIRIKLTFRVTNIADLIAARYGNSQSLAAIATFIVLIGVAPYIALQFKAIITSFRIISDTPENYWLSDYFGPIVVLLMIGFTISFGVRRLDPTERHSGMVLAVATESIVKLICFLAVGLFVSFWVFDSPADIFQRWTEQTLEGNGPFQPLQNASFSTWITYIVLAMSAIVFLPRQFHIAVVENSDEDHINTAMWLFPLYLFLINLFVLPIALGSLLTGLSAENADMFVLRLPLYLGHPWLALMVFTGGFAAAMSMIMISSMTISTMMTNYLILPIIDHIPFLGFLRRYLLRIRWLAITVVMLLGYWVETKLGGTHTLVNMGMISFAAALQFAPPIMGGMFWRSGNRLGATLGLSAGFLIWAYTLLLPSLIRSGWIPAGILLHGPWGIDVLRPESLFGMTGVEPLTHTVFWSMIFNIGLYLFGSLLFEEDQEDTVIANRFIDIMLPLATFESTLDQSSQIELLDKKEKIIEVLSRYLDPSTAEFETNRCLETMGLQHTNKISVTQLAEFNGKAEKILAGAVGTITAYKTFKNAVIFSPDESRALSAAYGLILANLNVTPEELRQKIDFYQERESILSAHAKALEQKVSELNDQIRERESVEAALRISQERYRVLLDASPDAIVAYGSDGNIVFVNKEFEKTYGWQSGEVVGKKIEFVPETEREKTDQAIRHTIEGENVTVDTQRLCKNGKRLDIILKTAAITDSTGRFIGYIVIHRDVTESKRIEDDLRQTQKMELVGSLAGGVAHDFNNILASILGTASLMKHRVDRDGFIEKSKLETYLETLMTSSARATDLTKHLLTLSRKQPLSLTAVDLVLAVKRVLDIAANTFDKSITLECEPSVSAATIIADGNQLEQVLLNLCLNASHAMTIMRPAGQPWGGTLSISISSVIPDKYTLQSYPVATAAAYWVISVKDTGIGMSQETASKVFTPFFTTKKEGVGTGLGLSMVYRIISQHNGFVAVHSEIDIGSSFDVYLPKSKTDQNSNTSQDLKENVLKGEGLILVIDDEDEVRSTTAEMLLECGYEILTAKNGKEGVLLFSKRHRDISAVLLDMSMPEMSGRSAYITMKEVDPAVKVLLVSGFKQDEQVKEALSLGVNGFLAKPFTLRSLARSLAEILEA